jgi:hypothetical protein
VNEFEVLLSQLFSDLSPMARAAVAALAQAGGKFLGADDLARRVGLRDRHGLARLLRREGLPPCEELNAQVSVIGWLHAWEADGSSLFKIAVGIGREPATCYRMVRRVTGVSWQKACAGGLGRQLKRFLERCDGSLAARSGRVAYGSSAAS